MGEVTGYTAERMKDIEDNTVVNGHIDVPSGHLKLTRYNGTEIDAGLVNVSPRIVTSATRPTAPNVFEGLQIYETDTNLSYIWDGAAWLPIAPAIPHSTVAKVTSTALSTTSTVFVNLGVNCQVVNFPKLRADTKLIVRYDGNIYNDDPGGLGAYEVGIQVNGVDNVVANGFVNLGQKSGVHEITGLAAGNYTCTLRKRRANGTGTVFDGTAGSRNALTVMETF
jgi:hypothetical protein